MSDGSYISPTLRKAYSSVINEFDHVMDPFNIKSDFGKFIKRNNLFSKPNLNNYSYPSINDSKNHGFYFKIIYFIMRIILKFVGPNKFYDLSKLMVYLSVYRIKDHKYWKI